MEKAGHPNTDPNGLMICLAALEKKFDANTNRWVLRCKACGHEEQVKA